MKKFSKYIFTLAALALATTACLKEEEYQKGAADVEGCYGVYFPTQDAAGSHTYDPSQPTEVEFTAVRLNSEGDITVPLKYTESHPGIFQLGELAFEDGQTEATLKVTFPESENGVTYKLSLSIDDPLYASRYNDGATNLDFSVMRVEWKYFLNPQTNAPANFTFTQTWWEEVHTGKVKYYEVNGVRTCVTETEPFTYDDGVGYGFWGTAAAQGEGELSFVWYTNTKLDEDETTDAVYLPAQVVFNAGTYGDIYVWDWYSWWTIFNPQAALVGVDFPTFAKKYHATNYPVGTYNNGTFSFYTHYYINVAGNYGGQADMYDIFLEAEGFIRTDYSLALKAGQSDEGELPVQFTTGPDVASVKYAAFEGALYATQVAKNVEEIIDGTVESNTITAAELAQSNVQNLSFDETGVYTVVAVTFDEKGDAQKNAFVTFSYVAADDEVPVVLTVGLGSADKYVPSGVNTDNALEYWAYGEDLESVKIGFFSAQDLAKDEEACIAAVAASAPVKAETLEAINGEGFVSVVNKLNPGTEYYLIAVASNGYETKVIIADGAFTTGDPHPVYMSFTLEDINDELLPASSEGYFGTYNYYARTTDEDGNLLGTRSYLGQITISDSEIADLPADDDGIPTEFVNVTGVIPYASLLGLKNTMEFEYYDGCLYAASATTGVVQGMNTALFPGDEAGDLYNAYLLGGFVEVGYLAFVNMYASKGFNINGFYLAAFGDAELQEYLGPIDAFFDILLIDPAKDDSGLAPEPEAPSTAQLKQISKTLAKGPTNYVETPRGNIRSIIDQARKTPVLRGEFTSIKGHRDAKAVEFKATASDAKVAATRNISVTKVSNISFE